MNTEQVQDAEFQVVEEESESPAPIAPYQPPDNAISPVPHVQVQLDLSPATLSEFVIEIPIGGKKVQTLSADGYQHILQVIGLQVRSVKVFTDPEDPDMWEGEALIYNPFTGASYIGGADEPKKYQNGRVNVNAKRSCRTKAIRNGIKGLVNTKKLQDEAIAYKNANVTRKPATPIQTAQARLKSAGEYYVQNFEKQTGVPIGKIRVVSTEKYGEFSDWDISEFDAMSDALLNPQNSWIKELILNQ